MIDLGEEKLTLDSAIDLLRNAEKSEGKNSKKENIKRLTEWLLELQILRSKCQIPNHQIF